MTSASLNQKKAPILSFVVGTRNRPHDLRRMIDSIEDYCTLDWELVIADASDTPIESQEIATARAWKHIRVLAERPRRGYTKGYNAAFAMARGRYCMFLNDDCIVERGTSEAAITFMEAHSEIGLGCIAYAEPGKPSYQIYSWMGLPYANFGILHRSFGDAIGWFDEDFPMYGSDNSLAFRVLLNGKAIAQVPRARIYHFATADTHRAENHASPERYAAAHRLFDKYGSKVELMKHTQAQLYGIPKLLDQTPVFTQ